MMKPTSIVHLLSGGLDSVVMLYDHVKQGSLVHCVLCDYAQTHLCELRYARHHCDALSVQFTVVELFRIKNMFQRCALTDQRSASVIVPNRNAVMLHIAAAIASSNDAEIVTYACNSDDKSTFPDCTWEFVDAMNATMAASKTPVEICAPYAGLSKQQIVARAFDIGMTREQLDNTWSCYSPTEKQKPCGKCDACRKRAEALK